MSDLRRSAVKDEEVRTEAAVKTQLSCVVAPPIAGVGPRRIRDAGVNPAAHNRGHDEVKCFSSNDCLNVWDWKLGPPHVIAHPPTQPCSHTKCHSRESPRKQIITQSN